jgi:tetratricopeptide (TPR) repeat protein
MRRLTGRVLQALQRLPTAVRLSRHIYRFSLLDDEAAERYLAENLELRGEAARGLLHDNLDRAVRQKNLPAMRRMYARIALVEAGGLPPLDANEITRRHEDAVARARTDDPRALLDVLAELEALLEEPGFAAAAVDARLPALADAGAMWMLYFELAGEPWALEQARARLEVAAALTEADPVRQGLVLSNLATVESRTFHLTGRTEHLERTVELLRRATDTEPRPGLDRAMHLVNLATALMELYSATLRGAILEESIERFREAEPFRADLPPDALVVYLRGVGSALLTRYRGLGQLADVQEAVAALRFILLLPDVMAHDRSTALTVLGFGLLQQARTEGVPGPADDAVKVLAEAVELAPENPLLRLNAISGLARAHRYLFDLTGDPAELDDAVACFAKAAELAPAGSHWEVRTLSDFGEALTTRVRAEPTREVPGREDDLRLAIDVLEHADRRARSPEVAGRLALALSTRVGPSGASWTHGARPGRSSRTRAGTACRRCRCRRAPPGANGPCSAAAGRRRRRRSATRCAPRTRSSTSRRRGRTRRARCGRCAGWPPPRRTPPPARATPAGPWRSWSRDAPAWSPRRCRWVRAPPLAWTARRPRWRVACAPRRTPSPPWARWRKGRRCRSKPVRGSWRSGWWRRARTSTR